MITSSDIVRLTSNGRFFRVVFVKRTDGSLRRMLARRGVKSKLAGGSLAFDPAKHDLLPVYDVQAGAYRSVPLDSIVYLKVDGKEYVGNLSTQEKRSAAT